jgi:hypothetical protein
MLETDVSGQHIGPIFEVKKRDILTPEDETDRLSRNVGKELLLYTV